MKKIVRHVVACHNQNDDPDLYFVKVELSQRDRLRGKGRTLAKESAKDEGYQGPFICFDEEDSAGKALMPLFAWDTASVVS
jgi:hypothetical protein